LGNNETLCGENFLKIVVSPPNCESWVSGGIGDELVNIRRKATQILHGKEIEGRTSFMEKLERFEEIIISLYKPKIFEKQAEIDELIREAEAHD